MKYKFGAGAVKHKLGPGSRAKAGGQGQGRGPGTTNTFIVEVVIKFLFEKKMNSHTDGTFSILT